MTLALTVIFWVFVAALVSVLLAGALILADLFLLPGLWPSRLFAPICAALGHTDEDTDEDEAGFGVCQRCGQVFWPAGG
jgi:hypothetical protein